MANTIMSFAHRLQLGSVKMVQVWRDVSLTSVCVCYREIGLPIFGDPSI